MTAELLARCREALKASDETAKAASPGPWLVDGNQVQFIDSGDRILVVRHTWPQEAAHIAANDPATRLALNAALRRFLDVLSSKLEEHDHDCQCAPSKVCVPRDDVLSDLAAIASALGVQEADRG